MSGLRAVTPEITERLQPELLIKIHELMLRTRVLEERLIRMFKQSEGYFWIGGPGEEAFNIPLGLQVKAGSGVEFDFLHLHYRSLGVLLAMGPKVLEPVDALRQMRNVATDPFSGGRNFGSHPSKHAFNITPVTSTIETQYLTAIGTAIAQKRAGGDAITIVSGGDAGTAEGDFSSCLVWATRPGNELPMLIIVTNNEFGISTPYGTQHGETRIADRAAAFNMPGRSIDGNDVETSWSAIKEAMEYVRRERRPYLLEAYVSRLHGHSSASGANLVEGEADPLVLFEERLQNAGILSREQMDDQQKRYEAEMLETLQKVRQEPLPDPSTIYDYVFCGQKGRYW